MLYPSDFLPQHLGSVKRFSTPSDQICKLHLRTGWHARTSGSSRASLSGAARTRGRPARRPRHPCFGAPPSPPPSPRPRALPRDEQDTALQRRSRSPVPKPRRQSVFQERSARKTVTPTTTETVLSNQIKLEGRLTSKSNIKFDGDMLGDLTTEGDVVVGDTGKVKGNVTGRNVVVSGAIEGDITTS